MFQQIQRSHADALLSTLERHTSLGPPEIPVAELEAAGSLRPERLHTALRKLFYNAVDGQLKNPTEARLAPLRNYFESLRSPWSGDDHFQYFLTYVSLMDEALRHGLTEMIFAPTPGGVDAVVRHLRGMTPAGETSNAALGAGHCIIGQVLSLLDREAASAEFAQLHEGAADLIRFFFWDSGALTYFGEAVSSFPSEDEVASIVRSMEPLLVRTSSNSLGIGVSVDPRFFRIYAPWLYFHAQQLPEIDFNIFLCASPERAEALVDDAERFTDALGRLNLSGRSNNLHIYRVSTPDFVAEEITFFACARFFAIQTLLERYSHIYLMDADLRFDDNPTQFFRSIQDLSFGAHRTTTATSLSPWRRFMAGNVPLNRGALDSGILADLQTYIVQGLRRSGSWMLDQNAIAYAIERDGGQLFKPLNPYKRPFVVSRFMRTWEANFRTATRARA